MITIKEVAKRAGVSKSTVSRVINNKGIVNGDTAALVYSAIKELNYRPNEVARTLFNKKSNIIGLIVPKTSHNFFSMLVERIDFHLFKNGYNLMIGNAFYDVGTEIQYLDLLNRHLVDGIIIASHTLNLENFKDIDLPIVTFDRIISDNIPFVESDNSNGGKMATEYLISKGCKCLAHIAGPKELDSPAHKRGYAFEKVCKENNIPYHVINTKMNQFGFEEGIKVIESLLKKYPDIDGVFASNDALGIAAIRVAQRLGKRVPEDIQIIGYDDVVISKISNPELTTIRQPVDDIASKLVESIIKQINREKTEHHTIIPVELIKRESTR